MAANREDTCKIVAGGEEEPRAETRLDVSEEVRELVTEAVGREIREQPRDGGAQTARPVSRGLGLSGVLVVCSLVDLAWRLHALGAEWVRYAQPPRHQARGAAGSASHQRPTPPQQLSPWQKKIAASEWKRWSQSNQDGGAVGSASHQQPTPPQQLSPWQKRIAASEWRRWSQSSQDGVLDFLFRDLGTTNRYFVEFGFNSRSFEGGSGANTLNLWRQGWTGLLMDGAQENLSINLHREMLGPHSILGQLRKYQVPPEFDYLSVDFDSYDLWTFREVVLSGTWRPRVVTVEYNPAFPLNTTCTLRYPDKDGFWALPDKVFGASLGALDLVAAEGGYTLVYVVTGLDAVFVRSDLLAGRDIAVTPVTQLPPERLVDDAPPLARCGKRKEERMRDGVSLGGTPGEPHLGYWCGLAVKNCDRVHALEDYRVFSRTKDHGAARRTALEDPYAKRLLKTCRYS